MQNAEYKIDYFQLRPSKQFILLSSLFIFLSLMVIQSLVLYWLIKDVVELLVVLYGIHMIVRDGLLRSKHSITNLKYEKNGWFIAREEKFERAILCGESTVTTFISILRFRLQGKKGVLSCLILRDSLSQLNYRRLIILTRQGV